MSNAEPETQSLLSRIGGVSLMAVSFALIPIAMLIAPRAMLGSMEHLDKEMLSSPENRKRIKIKIIVKTPAQIRLNEVRDLVYELVEDHDWVTLSDMIEDWDQSRAAAPDGTRLARFAIYQAAQAMGGPPPISFDYDYVDECQNGSYPFISDKTADYIQGVAATQAKRYPLAVLSAHLRLCQAWNNRGTDYADNISDDSWNSVMQHFNRAIWLLEPHDAKRLNAPLIASIHFDMVPFSPGGDTQVHSLYKEWSALDPSDQQPHLQYGHMLLPRWFGSYSLIEEAAHKAYAATHNVTGAAAYAAIYHDALPHEIGLALFLDLDLYKKGLSDLLAQTGDDPAYLAHLIQDVPMHFTVPFRSGLHRDQKKQIKKMRNDIDQLLIHLARTRLTAIHRKSWEFGIDEALDFLSLGLQDEINAGHNFIMGENGVEVVENSS